MQIIFYRYLVTIKKNLPHFDMYKLVVLPSSFGLFLPIFSVMMPASLLRKRTKTSPKYEQTEATYFFLIT